MSTFSDLKSTIINSNSLLDFFNYTLNIPVRSEGQCILAPSFIRSESHPSFAVYHDHAFDFSTHSHYNILDIYALYHFGNTDFESILKAAEYFLGHPINTSPTSQNSSAYVSQQQAFNDLINQWHSNLLNNPQLTTGEGIFHILDYLQQRRISLDTAKAIKLGWCPETENHYMRSRLIIPYFMYSDNSNAVYANGRYMGQLQTQANV